ncbi:hypothetical protein D3C85_1024860 [compost metagenome]
MLIHALEAGDHHHAACLEVGTDLLVVDLQDARLVVRAVGEDAHLVTGVGDRWYAALDQGHGQEGDGHLLTSGHHDIQFARYRLFADLLGQIDQAVGFAAHGGNHDHDVIAAFAELLHLLGHLLDAFDSADRGPPKLLYDQSHFKSRLIP